MITPPSIPLIKSFEAYLRQHPSGLHAAEAGLRLDSVRPVQGVLSMALGYSGLSSDGVVTLTPTLGLVTTAETFELLQSPSTKYFDIPKKEGGMVLVWHPGGKYEVTGKKSQPPAVKCKRRTLLLSTVRFVAGDKEEMWLPLPK